MEIVFSSLFWYYNVSQVIGDKSKTGKLLYTIQFCKNQAEV